MSELAWVQTKTNMMPDTLSPEGHFFLLSLSLHLVCFFERSSMFYSTVVGINSTLAHFPKLDRNSQQSASSLFEKCLYQMFKATVSLKLR